MTENFSLSELVIPGSYIRVRTEGLISVGGISSGNIGIVGTAQKLVDEVNVLNYDVTYSFSDYESALAELGPYDKYLEGAGTLNLTRSIELLFLNGARTVYARALPPGEETAGQDDFVAAFNELLKDDVNILVAPELDTGTAATVLKGLAESAETNGKDVIAVVGSDATATADIMAQGRANAYHRLILSAPGIEAYDAAASAKVTLSGTYSAAAVAGLVSTLVPQSSPTNKVLPALSKLSQRFSYGDTIDLINDGVLVLEERLGVRVVRGITTEMASNGAFKQITTRRITDFAKAGIRKASNPFIGKLNNQRVRKALQGAIDGFLTTMVQDEALIGYSLSVTASRQDEIAGRAIVNVMLQPTFSIDFVAVTIVLQ
jgi:hypothetical protein